MMIRWWWRWWWWWECVNAPCRSAYIINIFPWRSIGRCFRCRFLRRRQTSSTWTTVTHQTQQRTTVIILINVIMYRLILLYSSECTYFNLVLRAGLHAAHLCQYWFKARFPLPKLTARGDITRQHGPCWLARVSTSRVDGPRWRPVNSGSGNRA